MPDLNVPLQVISGRGPRHKEFEDHPAGYEQLTVANSSVGFASIPINTNKAVVIVETATIRYRDDGTAPTSSVGTKQFVNSTLILDGRDKIDSFRAIRTGATSAKLSINYYDRK